MTPSADSKHTITVIALIIDWIVIPCFVSVVSQTSRSTPLPRLISNDITHAVTAIAEELDET